jgi:hypothetical protein
LVRQVSSVARIPRIARSEPDHRFARADAPAHEPEHVEEVWDAELVGDLPRAGWLAVPALTTYLRAGTTAPAPLVDLRA